MPPALFGAPVVATFFLAKSEHAVHETVPRRLRRPGRQGPRIASPQVVPVSAVEVGEVSDLQRERITRMLGQQPVEARAEAFPVAPEPGADCGDVRPLALICLQLGQAAETLLDLGQDTPFPEGNMKLGTETMAHDEVRVRIERTVDGCYRVAAVGMELAERSLKGLDRRRGCR